MSILQALTHGYAPHMILRRLANANPKYANAIHNAHAAGYTADAILKHTIPKNDPDYDETENYLTEREQTDRIYSKKKKEAAITAVSLLGTAGALAAGGYQLYNMNRAIRPNEILPAQKQAPRIPGRQPLQIGQPGAPAPQRPIPQNPRDPSPIQPRPQGGPPQQRPQNQPPANIQEILQQNPIVEKNYNLVKNVGEESRFDTIAMQGLDIATAAQMARQILPKAKVAVLEKAEGGLEGVLANFMLYRQANPPAVREQFQPKQNQFNAPGRSQQPQSEQMQGQQEQTPGMSEEMQQAGQQEQDIPFIPEEQQQPAQQQAQPQQQEMMQLGQAQRPNLTENMQRIVGKIQPQRETESPQMQRDRFAIANKRAKDEKPQDFVKRKMLNDTLKTAAKLIASGKDFTDLPYQPSVTYSTAKDVLKLLAGAPTTFDELLDDEEKEEIFDAGNPKGIESSLQGAHMTPNLIWNLILSINPKVTDLVPPSIKGSKGKPAGGKMSTTEARRFLTHGVAGILGGKTVSFELADKIGKISEATSALDVIANAAIDGDIRKIEDQLLKLDPQIFEVLESELNSSVPESFAWMRKKAGLEKSFSIEPKEKKNPKEDDSSKIVVPSDVTTKERTGKYNDILIRGDKIDLSDKRIPEKVYHVTTNAPAVKSSGYLRAAGEGGLGGDKSDRIVSFTTNKKVANQLENDLKEVSKIGNENLTPSETQEYLRKIALKDGWEFDFGYTGEISPSNTPFSIVKDYYTQRSRFTDKVNPIFLDGSVLNIDPNKVEIIQVDKKNLDTGALITDFDLGKNKLDEIRVYGNVPLKKRKK